MKYRFLINKSKKPDYGSLYQYLTTTVDGVILPVEVDGDAALDTQVERMLNEQGFAKDDFIIVKVVDYTIDAKDYSSDEENAGQNQG